MKSEDGYSWDKQNKAILINPDEAEAVKYIFEEYVYRDTTSSLPKCLLRCSVRIIDIGFPPYRYTDSRFSTLPKTKVKKAVMTR